MLGYAYAHLDRPEEGVALAQEGVQGHESMGLLGGYRTAGRLDQALAEAERGLALSREHGQRGCEAWSLRLVGDAHIARGTKADEPYRAALSLAEELGMRPLVAHCHAALASLCRRMGRSREADEHFRTATSLYRDMDMSFWLARAGGTMP